MHDKKLASYVNDIKNRLHHTADFSYRTIKVNDHTIAIAYLSDLIDPLSLQEVAVEPLLQMDKHEKMRHVIKSVSYTIIEKKEDLIANILEGHAILINLSQNEVISVDVEQVYERSPEEPENEKVIRGSHQGFVEELSTNINLIRRRVRNEHMKIEYVSIGTETNTTIALIYMDNIANSRTVNKIRRKLDTLCTDMAFAPGYIEDGLEEHPFSVFPQHLYTERPDRVEAHLLEGRVAIMAESSSDAIITPVSFPAFFQSPDDFHKRTYTGTMFRLLRMISFFGTLLFPALYIAIIGFHFEMIPNEMIALMKGSIETVPFPPFFEVLIMILTIELIREAGIRLPTPIGQTIGIVGGIIIGESVVTAGLVSNVVVIVIAITAIMSFTLPSYEMSNTIRLLSLPIMIASALFGFVGIVASFMLLFIHLCRLEIYGTPYLSPITPLDADGVKDTFIRLPSFFTKRRPKHVFPKEMERVEREGEHK
ncbi:MAG TPA: spore germination protein [Pseudogracilibacillus sp.]|nr:spore germination protein [Pseudogracilibacillus sp.]